jgi:NAD-dependent SIR2 family protein deacetylase
MAETYWPSVEGNKCVWCGDTFPKNVNMAQNTMGDIFAICPHCGNPNYAGGVIKRSNLIKIGRG